MIRTLQLQIIKYELYTSSSRFVYVYISSESWQLEWITRLYLSSFCFCTCTIKPVERKWYDTIPWIETQARPYSFTLPLFRLMFRSYVWSSLSCFVNVMMQITTIVYHTWVYKIFKLQDLGWYTSAQWVRNIL